MIKIDRVAGCHNHAVFLFGRFDSAGFSSPAHHHRIRGQSAFEDLVPADQFFAFAVQVFLNPLDKITLQFVFIFQVIFFHPFLAGLTFFPMGLGTFIGAEMKIAGGE